MFGRKTKKQKREEHRQEVRKGLIFWLPGGSSRLDVYLDYCVIRCLGKTRMKEKERVIPFDSIQDVVYTPPSSMRHACLQLFTKEMPDVKKSYWYAYENNLVVVHPATEDLAQTIREYLLNPKGSNVIPPEYLAEIKQEMKEARRKEIEAKEAAEKEAREKKKAERAANPQKHGRKAKKEAKAEQEEA